MWNLNVVYGLNEAAAELVTVNFRKSCSKVNLFVHVCLTYGILFVEAHCKLVM